MPQRALSLAFVPLIGSHAENAPGPKDVRKFLTSPPGSEREVLDLLMPRMDGLAFLDVLYSDAALRDIPVIVLTAKLLSAGERQILQERVRGLVEKHGFSREDLVKEVRRVLAASGPINSGPSEAMHTPGSIQSREPPP